jgi:hypothetical protein
VTCIYCAVRATETHSNRFTPFGSNRPTAPLNRNGSLSTVVTYVSEEADCHFFNVCISVHLCIFQYFNQRIQLVIVFYFLSTYSLYKFQASSAHHQESSPLHLQPPFFFVAACLRHCLVGNGVPNKTVPQTGSNTDNWRL